MSEELYKRFQSAMLGFTIKNGLQFERCNARAFVLAPVQGARSAALQISFEPGFWDLYGQIDDNDLPSLHKNLLRQIEGYNPALKLQFAQTFYLKTEAVRRWHASHSPELKMPAGNHRAPVPSGARH